jgi:hypothetical protein
MSRVEKLIAISTVLAMLAVGTIWTTKVPKYDAGGERLWSRRNNCIWRSSHLFRISLPSKVIYAINLDGLPQEVCALEVRCLKLFAIASAAASVS